MIRIYHPYWLWEDFNSGMWRKVSKDDEILLLKLAIEFTGNHIQYGMAMEEVVFKWKYAMEHNLTNTSLNRLAFIGHCAAQYRHKIPEYITRMAWAKLSETQREDANHVALKVLKKWEYEHNNKNSKQLY